MPSSWYVASNLDVKESACLQCELIILSNFFFAFALSPTALFFLHELPILLLELSYALLHSQWSWFHCIHLSTTWMPLSSSEEES
jgi:hypothetical protein